MSLLTKFRRHKAYEQLSGSVLRPASGKIDKAMRQVAARLSRYDKTLSNRKRKRLFCLVIALMLLYPSWTLISVFISKKPSSNFLNVGSIASPPDPHLPDSMNIELLRTLKDTIPVATDSVSR